MKIHLLYLPLTIWKNKNETHLLASQKFSLATTNPKKSKSVGTKGKHQKSAVSIKTSVKIKENIFICMKLVRSRLFIWKLRCGGTFLLTMSIARTSDKSYKFESC